ncbi:hypothetical protein ACTI_78380 [Actinoplanes sp. OR16]|uniref:hypothetical protein n=1 Tax=Actinoplanes sp. OR16 TaxID=946334 RepID=UPI000F6CE95E|nr:hypothetical protein [Actinoplanes sp. OR16]BBH71153.1 hypothetical protein ACTI_78380 [Actinoplanes sp. OR16]
MSQWYARRARIAFICASLGCWIAAGAVLSAFMLPLYAVGLGLAAGVLLGLVTALVVRVWPVLRALWWWSLEITIAAVVVAAVARLVRVLPWWLALIVALLPVAGVLLVGPVRRFVFAWSWCVVDRHRLRLCFTQIVRASHGGPSRPLSLPLMLWARPTPAGERVWLWLRPGLSLEDLDGKTGRIAVGCAASEVRVSRARPNLSALVRVDVTRRDPLTGLVPSPLSLLLPARSADPDWDAAVPVSPAVSLVGLDLADVPEPPAPEPRAGGRR